MPEKSVFQPCPLPPLSHLVLFPGGYLQLSINMCVYDFSFNNSVLYIQLDTLLFFHLVAYLGDHSISVHKNLPRSFLWLHSMPVYIYLIM